MQQDNLLLSVAIAAVIIAIVGVGVTYNSVSTFNNFLTGFATENGTVNVSVESSAEINISSAGGTDGTILDWGTGTFDSGINYATLVSNGTVVGGTWDTVSEGFIVDNVGNVPVNLSIYSTANGATFLGSNVNGVGLFQYNITNIEAGSCTDDATYTLGTWESFTTSAVNVCNDFENADPDQIRIDILLGIPSGGNLGALTNTMVLSYEAS